MTHFYGLQYLRFISAMLVVVMHATEAVSHRLPGSGMTMWSPGAVGVDIFFVISGFVMAMTTPDSKPGQTSWQLAVTFMRRRLIRIVPLYWFYTTLKILMVLLLPALALRTVIEPGHVLASFLFWPMLSPWGLVQPVLPVGWSLNFEMLFYVIFAVGIALNINKALFCLVVFGLIQGLATWLPDSVALTFFAQSIIFEFFLGVLVAMAIKRFVSAPGWLLLLLCGAGLYFIFLHPFAMEADRALAWGVPAACLVYVVVAAERFFPLAQPWFKAGAFWGDASYSIYLSHSFVVPGAVVAATRLGLDAPWAIALLAVLASAVAGGVSYQWLEKPVTQRLKAAYH